MYLVRGFIAWLLIIFAESIHGTLRQLFLAPLIGDFPARRVAFFAGVLLIFGLAYWLIRWMRAENTGQLFAVGLMWTILTLSFEVGLGMFGLNYSPERIFEDYDVSRGGLMGFGLLFMLFTPYLAVKSRGIKGRKPADF